MESIQRIQLQLQKLIGLHRQLMDLVRAEREALTQADRKSIEELTLRKEALVEQIRASESERQKLVATLAIEWRKPLKELTLSSIVIALQGSGPGSDPKLAEQLRSSQQTLVLLAERIQEANQAIRVLVERSLGHVQTMKSNVLGGKAPHSTTYSAQGQRVNPRSGEPRLLSKEI